jgi:hypothetical protein
MYQLYIIDESAFDSKKLIGEFSNIDNAYARLEKEFVKDKDTKYILEETSGQVDSYGDLLATVVEEN